MRTGSPRDGVVVVRGDRVVAREVRVGVVGVDLLVVEVRVAGERRLRVVREELDDGGVVVRVLEFAEFLEPTVILDDGALIRGLTVDGERPATVIRDDGEVVRVRGVDTEDARLDEDTPRWRRCTVAAVLSTASRRTDAERGLALRAEDTTAVRALPERVLGAPANCARGRLDSSALARTAADRLWGP